MSLVDLSVPVTSPRQWMVWSYSNQDQHTLASAAIFTQHGINLPRYPLDPIPPEPGARGGAPGPTWLYTHQQWHNAINSVLGVSGVDLTAVDFSRQDQAEAWAYFHSTEHLQWAQKLGLS